MTTGVPMQFWKLTSESGKVSLWCTTILRSYDGAPTERDMRSIAFPRIISPLGADWQPRGLRWASLRHPVRNARQLIKAKWNNARCDPLVFIGVKRAPWADIDILTSITKQPIADENVDLDAVIQNIAPRHAEFIQALQQHLSTR